MNLETVSCYDVRMDKKSLEDRLELLDEMRALTMGWCSGQGEGIQNEAIEVSKNIVAQLAHADVELPYVYPNPDGSCELEWDVDDASGISITVLKHDNIVCFHFRSLQLDDFEERTIASVEGTVEWLMGKLRKSSPT